MQDDRQEFIRTTVYISREMHEAAKMMAVFTRSNVSTIMRAALNEKLSKIKEQYKKDKTEDRLN
jgi:post-segregation antitoxin (ccd killing protein)